jgi:CRISPR-associated protein Cas2
MSLTFVVTQNVDARFRGFLGSLMLELASGVYVSARMNLGTRERVLEVLRDWHGQLQKGSIVAVWMAKGCPGGIGIEILGEPLKTLVETDNFLLTCRPDKS